MHVSDTDMGDDRDGKRPGVQGLGSDGLGSDGLGSDGLSSDGAGAPPGGPLSDPFDWYRLWKNGGATLSDPGRGAARSAKDVSEAMARVAPLPPAELLAAARRFAVARQVRDDMFGLGMFLNPGWNILLELFIAGEEGRNVTIKSACVAACVPQSTALRHIAHLNDVRLAVRAQHPSDARSAYLKLSEQGRTKMVAFLTLSARDPAAPGA